MKKKFLFPMIRIIIITKGINMLLLKKLNKIIIKNKKEEVTKNLLCMKRMKNNFKENYIEILNPILKIEYMNNV